MRSHDVTWPAYLKEPAQHCDKQEVGGTAWAAKLLTAVSGTYTHNTGLVTDGWSATQMNEEDNCCSVLHTCVCGGGGHRGSAGCAGGAPGRPSCWGSPPPRAGSHTGGPPPAPAPHTAVDTATAASATQGQCSACSMSVQEVVEWPRSYYACMTMRAGPL